MKLHDMAGAWVPDDPETMEPPLPFFKLLLYEKG